MKTRPMTVSAALVAVLAVGLHAQAAETAAVQPGLPVKSAAASMPVAKTKAPASTPAAKNGGSAAGRPASAAARSRTRALGSDDDLKDLEVERVRGKSR